tara:strand:+ start:1349 stop:1597 length:249 start_codon:yes stop_codon:yes gene_type:complete
MKNNIMFGATKSKSGPDPKYAPIDAVTIERASRLYTFFIKTNLSEVAADDADATPLGRVVVFPNLMINSCLIFKDLEKIIQL